MRATSNAVLLLCAVALIGAAHGQNGQVKFRGTATTNEAHDVAPVCYGDYHVTVDIGVVLEDPNQVLAGMDSVQVCYETALGLACGEDVEVYGCYWGGGSCPKQDCMRVHIQEASDHIIRTAEYGDSDWMVSGDLMYSIASGNVGIGTSRPAEKLHVVGNLLVQGASPAWLRLMGELGDDAGINLTMTGAGVNAWDIVRESASARRLLSIAWSCRTPPMLPAGPGPAGGTPMAPSGGRPISGRSIMRWPR